MSMFCYQCEQTSQCTGCTTMGICGKTPETANLQDAIVYLVKGISFFAHEARLLGVSDVEVNDVTLEALFMTLTNVNFDADEHVVYIDHLRTIRNRARTMYRLAATAMGLTPKEPTGPAAWHVPSTKAELLDFAKTLSILADITRAGDDIVGLREMLVYGIKGMAAYAHHAAVLGYRDDSVLAFIHEALSYTVESEPDTDKLLQLCLKAGATNLKVMELLDRAHTETLGHPVPTPVLTTHKKGKCILVSGHDMRSLLELLKHIFAR